ncbi:MAG: HD domain-containing phosphohydrolase, partial [Chloroflexia bacterium]
EIPLEARILGVCDAAEAMASDRPYRKGVRLEELVAEVGRYAGTQFDPRVAAAFVRVVEREREGLVTNSAIDVRQEFANGSSTTRHLTGALLTGSLNGHFADSMTGELTGPLTGPLVMGNLTGHLGDAPNMIQVRSTRRAAAWRHRLVCRLRTAIVSCNLVPC